jgi:hypothetical protein
MSWIVLLADEFRAEFVALDRAVRVELSARVNVLEEIGPNLGRPRVDSLRGSRYANMKELRFRADGGVWRVAFAFDPRRQAILLVAGDKSGTNEGRFYELLVRRADARFDAHLTRLATETGGGSRWQSQ